MKLETVLGFMTGIVCHPCVTSGLGYDAGGLNRGHALVAANQRAPDAAPCWIACVGTVGVCSPVHQYVCYRQWGSGEQAAAMIKRCIGCGAYQSLHDLVGAPHCQEGGLQDIQPIDPPPAWPIRLPIAPPCPVSLQPARCVAPGVSCLESASPIKRTIQHHCRRGLLARPADRAQLHLCRRLSPCDHSIKILVYRQGCS